MRLNYPTWCKLLIPLMKPVDVEFSNTFVHRFFSGIIDLYIIFSMCGDHPSFTKTELNAKLDIKMDEKDKEKAKDKAMSYAKITPTVSGVCTF